MDLDNALEKLRTELEDKIRRQLSGLQGLIVKPVYNSMMPLEVEIALASQAYVFVFYKDGIVRLKTGFSSAPDVRIQSDPETFISLFQAPSPELFNELERQGKIRVTSLTKKGNDAEGYIRRYLAG